MRLLNKNIVLTGAAGQLGKAFTDALISEGAKLWLIDKYSVNNKNFIKNNNTSVIEYLDVDVSSQDDVRKAFQRIIRSGYKLDVLINNAGIGVFTPFWDRTEREFIDVLMTNVGGTFFATREALKIMKNQPEGGSIINIGSIYGQVSSNPKIYTDCSRINSEVYSASKAGVIQLTKYFAIHAAEYGVRVNCISPGGVFNNQGSDFIANYASRTPYARMADVSEMCGALIFFASKESSYVTGQNLTIDGGFTSW